MSACSSIPGFGKEDPRDARRYATLPNLEVPPAFTAPDPSLNTDVPRSASALGEAAKGDRVGTSGVLPKSATVSVEGPPDARWLNVAAAPENVWPRLINFLQNEGYPLQRQDPKLGVMESDWVGKGENAPEQTGWASLLKGITAFFFKPEYMDRIRIRIERGDNDTQTRVFLTSQRMDLVDKKEAINANDYEGFKWSAAPENREFDAEMLERLMAALTGDEEQSKQQIAASLQPRVSFVNEENKQYLLLDQSLPVAFNRSRAAVERLGFDIVKGDLASESLQLSHPNPRQLYQGINLRGMELKPTMGTTPVTLTLNLKPLSAGKTQINMQDIKGDKDLPQFTNALGQQLAKQLR
ncbi:MAG: outer membrane protein assembly factor BamC [Halothiobacillaceae bacterium]